MVAGRSLELHVSVKHAGRGSPWPQTGSHQETTGGRPVIVTGSWYAGGGTGERIGLQAAALPRTLAPGGTVSLRLSVTAVDATGQPLGAGRYTVDVSPQQEGQKLFSHWGDPPLELPVEVTDG